MANKMKPDKLSIKIIKREEREKASRSAPSSPPPVRGKEDGSVDSSVASRGKATSTVAGWVREFQSRRKGEQVHAMTVRREELIPLQEDDRGLLPA